MKDQNFKPSIPKWFDLKNYAQSECFPLLDWTLNLHFRKELLLTIELSNKFDAKNEYEGEINASYELIKANGILNRTMTSERYEIMKYEFNLLKMKPGFGLVYPLPLFRAEGIHRLIQSDTELRHQLALVHYQKIHYNTRNESMRNKEASMQDWHDNFFMTESYDDHYDDYRDFSPNICVDLGAPDETLVVAFKDWLKSMRNDKATEGSELPEKVSSNLTKKWKQSAILPYLDLELYQKIEGVSLPMHMIGEAIYPSSVDFDTTEAVRKTTRSNAEKAISQCYGIMRHALIHEELNGNGK